MPWRNQSPTSYQNPTLGSLLRWMRPMIAYRREGYAKRTVPVPPVAVEPTARFCSPEVNAGSRSTTGRKHRRFWISREYRHVRGPLRANSNLQTIKSVLNLHNAAWPLWTAENPATQLL